MLLVTFAPMGALVDDVQLIHDDPSLLLSKSARFLGRIPEEKRMPVEV